jgi:hypothetical protein
MYDAELLTVATGAAGTLVAAIATWGAEEARAKVAHFFHRDTAQRDVAVRAVEETAARLQRPDAAAHAGAVSLWVGLIAPYLAQHREAMSELDELATSTRPGAQVWNQNNHGSGTFIGGSVHGPVTLHAGGSHGRG